jgi:hypothetical protein
MSLAEKIDFPPLMSPVAARLLGEPNAKMSKYPHDVRFGSHGSISVNYEKGTFYDFEANTGGGVLHLIMDKTGRSYSEAIWWLRQEGLLSPNNRSALAPRVGPMESKPIANASERIVDSYQYHDCHGALLFEVVRYEPKGFRQRRPGPGGKWIGNLEGVTRVLYRLPQVLEAVRQGRTIYVCEGEKDADSICELSLEATTNPGGARKWSSSYSETLRDADVVLLPHNDDPGRAHAEAVARALKGVARRVRVLDIASVWPACPHKGDISDWLESGHSRPEFDALVSALSDWRSPTIQIAQIAQISPTQDVWPKMEAAAFHGVLGKIVHAIEPHSEADPNGILLQLLVAFGNAVGLEPYYPVEGDKHRAKLFVVLSGATSKGRKGTALGRIRQLMARADAEWEQNNIQSGLSSGEGLIYHVRDAVEKVGKDGELQEIDPGVSDKRVMLVVEEFAGALHVMERPGNTLSSVLRDAWGTARLQTLTKNSPTKATDSHVSMIGHITDQELRAFLNRTEMANGFANRIIFARVKRSKLLPHGGHLDERDWDELAQILNERLAQARRIGRVTMSEPAAKAWEQTYPDLSADRPGLLGAIRGRAEAQVIRLALIFALADAKPQIELAHLGAAFAVWSYCEDSAAQIWGDIIGDDVADAILGALKVAGREGSSRTELSKLFSRHQSSGRISTALALLDRMNKIERGPSAGHGEQRWRCR